MFSSRRSAARLASGARKLLSVGIRRVQSRVMDIQRAGDGAEDEVGREVEGA